MCGTCGCDAPARIDGQIDGQVETLRLELELDVLARNDALATENRQWLAARGVTAVNLMSSPGSGKTTLLERTLTDLAGVLECCVVEGDQETPLDADRIRATGAKAVQVNTGTGCHLEAGALGQALRTLDPSRGSVVVVENVGNLVCPALFDLGELTRVVLTSVTEGEDKPLKYPHIFQAADVVLLNKVDLLPHVAYDADRFVAASHRVNPTAEVMPLSAATGDGLSAWYAWLAEASTQNEATILVSLPGKSWPRDTDGHPHLQSAHRTFHAGRPDSWRQRQPLRLRLPRSLQQVRSRWSHG